MLFYITMAYIHLRPDEEPPQRCGGCDTFETIDGCECREVPCVVCGKRNHIYNMEHCDKYNESLWADLSFEDKLNGFHCEGCEVSDDEDEEAFCDEDDEDDDYC